MSEYLSQREIADHFKKSERTIGLWVKKGMINPVNPDTQRSDGGYRFALEEFERVNKLFSSDILFRSKAAKLIGITPEYLGMLAKANPPQIPCQIIDYGDQKRIVFRKADCIAIIDVMKKRDHTPYIRENGRELACYDNGLRLFDSFNLKGQKVVVVSVDPVRLLTENHYIIEPKDYLHQSKPCLDLPYVRRKGFIMFGFPKSDVDSPIYELLSHMIVSFGTKNIRVFETESNYQVRCRLGKMKGKEDDLRLLETYKQEGYLSLNGEYIDFDGEVVTRSTNYIKNVHERIK
jgi:hypothetical protein